MASSAMITVPTTASRFALLQIDSDSDSDASDAGKSAVKGGRDASGKSRQGKAGAGGKAAAQCNDKKKDKKKKKREQQQTEANEVRDGGHTCLWMHTSVLWQTWIVTVLLCFHFTWPESANGGNTGNNSLSSLFCFALSRSEQVLCSCLIRHITKCCHKIA